MKLIIVGVINLTTLIQLYDNLLMKNSNISAGYCYPTQIISHVVCFYHRFTLSFHDIEELLAAK